MPHLARNRLPVIVDRTGDRSIFLRLGFNLLSDFLAFEFDIDVDWGREEVRRHPEYDTSVDGQVGPTRGSVSSHTSLGLAFRFPASMSRATRYCMLRRELHLMVGNS